MKLFTSRREQRLWLWVLPNRVFDPQDILFNVLAALMAVTVSVALASARKQTDRWRGI